LRNARQPHPPEYAQLLRGARLALYQNRYIAEAEMQALIDSALDYDEQIRRSGHYIVSDALQPARTARTIRVRGGRITTTDGPFAETKEQLGGFPLIEARDMDEACEVASRFPPARVGIIEVRPVQELKHS
jgi:hypothetical protein